MSAAKTSSARVLVTGATGNTGRGVAAGLAELGFTVRTATRHSRSPEPAAEHARFDWEDATGHDEALAGVDRMYLVAPAFAADPSVLMLPFIDRALARGVRRIVLLSSSAVPEGAPGLGAVHRALRERAPEWSVLRPSWFMQNFTDARHHHGASLERDGTLLTATGEGRTGFVDATDIAAVAVRALADEASHDTAHVITGPEALSYDDVAAIFSRVTGRAVRHVHASPEEVERHMRSTGIPEGYARLLSQLDERIRRGEEAQVTGTVRRVAGREPRSFADFVRASTVFQR